MVEYAYCSGGQAQGTVPTGMGRAGAGGQAQGTVPTGIGQ